ncbi:MAG: hypothetical protein R3C25_07960 [Hyphomonadaceae bacterium]
MSKFCRTLHRWTSIAFALAVAAIFALLGLGRQPAQWLYYAPLLPLLLLSLTGLYMFFQPYFAQARGARNA